MRWKDKQNELVGVLLGPQLEKVDLELQVSIFPAYFRPLSLTVPSTTIPACQQRVAAAKRKLQEKQRAQGAKEAREAREAAKAAQLAAEVELKATRTRRKASKVDYVYDLGSEVIIRLR